jgi:hypothetical protein
MFDHVRRELAALWSSVGDAIERWGEAFTEAAARRGTRQPRVGPVPTRLPAPRVRRPVPHPPLTPERLSLRLAPRLRTRRPPTVLARQRHLAADRPGGTPIGQVVEAGAERAAALLRQRLLDLQRGLAGLQDRVRRQTRRGR